MGKTQKVLTVGSTAPLSGVRGEMDEMEHTPWSPGGQAKLVHTLLNAVENSSFMLHFL